MYDSVLVPVDGSDPSEAAADHALDLAAEVGATLHVLYVVDVEAEMVAAGAGGITATLEESLQEEGERVTSEVADQARERGVEVETSVVRGVPHEAIREYADEQAVDLLLIGTHGPTGIERHLLGSTTERVVRTTDRPVLTVSSREPSE